MTESVSPNTSLFVNCLPQKPITSFLEGIRENGNQNSANSKSGSMFACHPHLQQARCPVYKTGQYQIDIWFLLSDNVIIRQTQSNHLQIVIRQCCSYKTLKKLIVNALVESKSLISQTEENQIQAVNNL